MSLLFGNLFQKEFIVDEAPEAIADQPKGHSTLPWKVQPPFAPSAAPSVQQPKDLLTQITDLLREQERLEVLADSLQARKDAPGREELSRFFKSMITVLDGFDRTIQSSENLPPSEEVENWLKSVASIQSRMIKTCERFGLRAMDPVGKAVDLDQHEVVEVLRTESIADETVVEVRQKGYYFDGKILRDAQVVVAKNEGS